MNKFRYNDPIERMKRVNRVYFLAIILSLNASVESARTGESGRGFAVIADQIRQLAEETNHLTEMNVGYARQTWESIQKINQSAGLLKNV